MTLPIRRMIHRQFENVGETMNFLNQNMLRNHDPSVYSTARIEIDFSQCSYIEPYHVAPLACIIHEYLIGGFNVEVIGLNKPLEKYFHESGFLDFCSGHYKEDSFPEPKDKNTLPLWRIMDGAHNIYPQLAEQYFESHRFKGKDLQPLNTALGEMMNNVFDHSLCKIPGYTITQYHPKQKKLFTCVCDLGCTIPVSVNNYLAAMGEPQISPIDALVKSMEKEFSSFTQPHNRGRGLDTLVSIVHSLNGMFILVSGSAAYRQAHGEEERFYDLLDNFPGTMVVIGLQTDHLEMKEMEMTDDLHVF